MKKLQDSIFFFSSRRRHTRYWRDWSSDVCSSDLRRARGPHLGTGGGGRPAAGGGRRLPHRAAPYDRRDGLRARRGGPDPPDSPPPAPVAGPYALRRAARAEGGATPRHRPPRAPRLASLLEDRKSVV